MVEATGIVGEVWFPGKMDGLSVAPVSERALAIAKKREELLLLWHDLPESEYELSFTDLVENGTAAGNQIACGSKSFDEECLNKTMVVKEKKKRSSSSRSSFSGSRSSSDRVLLNFYVPTSLSRSVTTPKSSHRQMSDCSMGNGGLRPMGCWSILWQRGNGKSKRQALERSN